MRIQDEAYFHWLMGLSGENGRRRRKLCRLLHETQFEYTMALDGNRAMDGVNLRCRYAGENGIVLSQRELHAPCTVLEMMTALARRCEEHITDDPDLGDRTGMWFEGMLESLGLGDMDDAHYREQEARRKIRRFLTRRYRPNGQGGLFTLRHCAHDLREVDIWYQLMWYLNETLYERR